MRYECRLAWLYLSNISLFYCVHTVFYLPSPTSFFLLPFSDAVGISAAFFSFTFTSSQLTLRRFHD
jgi:hypothetical protein